MLNLSFIRILCVVALSALCIAGQTQQSTAGTDKPETPSSRAITGRVVNESGQPLPNAIVSVRASNIPNSAQNVFTDRQGSFQVKQLEENGLYYVNAILPAYTIPQAEPGQTQRTYKVGDSVTLKLYKGGVITGTVTNAAGEALVGIRVRAQRVIRVRNGRRVSGQGLDRETDDRGVYRIYGLLPGAYVVMAGGAGNQWSWGNVDPYDTDVPTYAPSATRDTAPEISVRAGEETAGIDIRYRSEQGRLISGVVTGTSDFNVTLTPVEEGGAPGGSSSTAERNGQSFSFVGISDGDYDLIAFSSSPDREYRLSETERVRVRGADVTGIELSPRPLGSVAGRVVLEETKIPQCEGKSRSPFAEMTVGAWHNDTEAAKELPPVVWSLGVPVRPDAQGNFTVRNLAPGEYFFSSRITAKYWYQGSIQLVPAATSIAKKPIDATRVWTNLKFGERREGLTITLLPGGASFSGQLVLGEGEEGFARTFVYLAPVERERAENPLTYFGTTVTSEGKITMNSIAPGRYWILAQTMPEDTPPPMLRLRFPNDTETRAQIRREAEAAKTEIEFKPCQEVTDFKLSKPLNQ